MPASYLCQGQKIQPMCYHSYSSSLDGSRNKLLKASSRMVQVQRNICSSRGQPTPRQLANVPHDNVIVDAIIREITEQDRLDTILTGLCDSRRWHEADLHTADEPRVHALISRDEKGRISSLTIRPLRAKEAVNPSDLGTFWGGTKELGHWSPLQ